MSDLQSYHSQDANDALPNPKADESDAALDIEARRQMAERHLCHYLASTSEKEAAPSNSPSTVTESTALVDQPPQLSPKRLGSSQARTLVATESLRTDLVMLDGHLTQVLDRPFHWHRSLVAVFATSSLCLLTGALFSPSHRRIFSDVFLAELCLTTPFLAFPAFRMHLVRQCLTRVGRLSDQLERQALSTASNGLLVSWHWSALRWSLRVI